jgi:hypothetical protein
MIPVQYRALAAGLGLLLALALAGAAGWFTNGWRHDAEIAELQRAHAETMRSQSELALTTLQADAKRTKELRNAKPLPAGCVPDADRVRNLDAAIEAANKSIPR